MNKKAYKQLQKNLSKKFIPSKGEYSIIGAVFDWVDQSGIKSSGDHLAIICLIFGSVPYPYQKADRKKILKFLKKNNYKSFKLIKL